MAGTARSRVLITIAAFAVAVAVPGVAIAGYWDFQGTLHDYPTVPYEYGELNPNNTVWGIRLSRSNCEAKILLRRRSDLSVVVWNIPGGCGTLDYSLFYDGSYYDASDARNTDTGPGDVWVNVRVDSSL